MPTCEIYFSCLACSPSTALTHWAITKRRRESGLIIVWRQAGKSRSNSLISSCHLWLLKSQAQFGHSGT